MNTQSPRPHNPPLLEIPHDRQATFQSRPNRFLGLVAFESASGEETEEVVHIHDPGPLEELLYPGNSVLIRKASSQRERRTSWDLIAARNEKDWILVNSGYHRYLAERILKDQALSPLGKVTDLRAEVPFGHSRIDFAGRTSDGNELLIEIKGCTLAIDGLALFPDAPTKRGKRHLDTLIAARNAGLSAAIIILVFRPEASRFAPNVNTDPAFAATFRDAIAEGVGVHPLVLAYDGREVRFIRRIPWQSDDDVFPKQ